MLLGSLRNLLASFQLSVRECPSWCHPQSGALFRTAVTAIDHLKPTNMGFSSNSSREGA